MKRKGKIRLLIEESGNQKPAKRRFGNRDQFAPLLLEFSDAIKKDRARLRMAKKASPISA